MIKKKNWVLEAKLAQILLILTLGDVFTNFVLYKGKNNALSNDLRLDQDVFVNGFAKVENLRKQFKIPKDTLLIVKQETHWSQGTITMAAWIFLAKIPFLLGWFGNQGY